VNKLLLNPWFSKWAASPLGSDFEGQWGEQNKGAIGEQNNTKEAKTLNHFH